MSQKYTALESGVATPVTRGDYRYIVKSSGNTVTLEELRADETTWQPLRTWVADEVDQIVSLSDGQIRVTLGANTSFEYAPHFTKRL